MNKKARNTRIIFHELLFALAIALFFVVLVMIAMGYRLRRDSESGLPVFERTALLRVGSYPTGARIVLNDTDTGRRTTLSAQRLVVSAGSHTLRVVRDGYHSWQHAFTASEAEITWFDYIQLFPTGRSGEVVQSFDSAHQIWRSSIGERAIVLTPATKASNPKLSIVTLSASSVNSTSINLTSEITNPDLVVWSKDDGLAFLCEKKPATGSSTASRTATNNSAITDKCLLVDIDRSRASTVSLPTERAEDLLDVVFLNSHTLLVVTSTRAFLYDTTTKTVQKLDAKIPNNNRPEHLAATTNDATLLYFSKVSAEDGKTSYHLATVNASGALETIYADDTPFEFASTRYLNDIVVAIANRSRLKIYYSNSNSLFGSINGLNLQNEYDLRSETTPIIADGRFIITADGLSIDLERWVESEFDNTCHDTTWQKLSSAQLYCPNDNQLLVKDFDGENLVGITLPEGVTTPILSSSLTSNDLPTTMKPAALVNRRTLYYWTTEHVNDTLQLQLRQLRL